MQTADVAIIGGGIIGLATAHNVLLRYPQLRVIVLEKETEPAAHQTGHNSGVLHSGIYYRPGSLKAINCREGKRAMEAFCESEGIDYEICGKVIVAVNEKEIPLLEKIYDRGQENGVRCEIIGRDRLTELEPHSAGLKAIHVPESGIVNFRQVCQRLVEILREHDGEFICTAKVMKLNRGGDGQITLATTQGDFEAKYVVNCAGLHCDRVTKMGGQKPKRPPLTRGGEPAPQTPHIAGSGRTNRR